MRVCSSLAFLLVASSAFAGPAVLIEESRKGRDVEVIESTTEAQPEWNRPVYHEESEQISPSRTPASERKAAPTENFDSEESERAPTVGRRRLIYPPGHSSESFSSIFELRRRKRLGVGASFMGRAGFVGLDAELNLTEENSAIVSVGGGPGYSGTSVGWKWTPLHGTWHPTASMAVSSWVTDESARATGESIPAFFNSEQGSDDRTRQVYLVPAFGMQTMKLSGESAGAQLYVEVLLFTRIPTFDLKPLGSVGAKYFF